MLAAVVVLVVAGVVGYALSRPKRPRRSARRFSRLPVLAAVVVLVVAGVIGYALPRPKAWERIGAPITVHAWAPYWQTDSALASFNSNTDVFSDLSLFAYHATAAGAVESYDGLDPNVPPIYRQAANAAGVRFTASIVDDTGKGAMASILANPVTRAVHVETILRLAVGTGGNGGDGVDGGGFDGIDIDYETFAFGDDRDTWQATRPNWVLFVEELSEALHEVDKTLTVSVPPMYDPERTGGDRGYWVYDYEAIGKVVDYVRVMAYDYSTAEAGPIAPIAWVKGLVSDIKKMVPAEKLILGIPAYGYNWPTSTLGVCPVGQEPKRQNQSTKSAAALAAGLGIIPTFDPDRAESTFTYNERLTGTDPSGADAECTVTRTVWYADARAVYERAWLAERQDLAGIAIWSLGSDDELVWPGIDAARADMDEWPPRAGDGTTDQAATVFTAG